MSDAHLENDGQGYGPAVVLEFLVSSPFVAQLLDCGPAALEHVSRHTEGGEIRLDRCPCPRGVEGLPKDDLGRPILRQLGEGTYISSAQHTLGDLARDVVEG
jgi:hypothetical protein